MPGRASIDQGDFGGGEWGPLAYGRHDDPRYSTALALSLNGYPVEERAWTRRSGTQFIVPTAAKRTYANLLTFEGSETCSFGMEFTNGLLRMITQTGVICTNDATANTTILATHPVSGQITLSGAPTWSIGDLGQISFPDVSSALYPYPLIAEANLRNRVVMLTPSAGTQAFGYYTFTGNPVPNDTITIRGTAVTFVASGASGNQVNIGATATATVAALKTFLQGAGAPFNGQGYAAAVDVSGNPVLYIVANATGTAGNAYTITASSLVITPTGATLSGGSSTNLTLTISDDMGVAFTGIYPNGVVGALVGAQILHHKMFTTPYTTVPVLSTLRAVQAEVDSIILQSSYAPYQLQVTTAGSASSKVDPVFTFAKLNMVDGPYQDPQAMSLSMSAISGSGVTLTAGSAAFASTDVGRHVRIFTQPANYNPASTYVATNSVTDAQGAWWTAISNVNAGTYPGQLQNNSGTPTVVWVPAPAAGTWAWGKITAFTDSTHVTFTFDTTIPGMVLQSANGTSAASWQLGVYSDTTGYPTCGIYYEGRLFLGGAVANRFDTTISNGVSQIIGTNSATFSPTDPYGTVLDSSGLSLVFNSVGINNIQWFIADQTGVLMGNLHGEVLIAASALGDPITPTSIQAHELTRYGSPSNQEPVRAGMSIIFTQKNGRRVMEYLFDGFSGKPSGRHLNEMAKHLTVSGVAKLAYTEEPVPMVWALMNNGMLTGCTYRRHSRFVQTPPELAGWHWNVHGGNRVFTAMCSVPTSDGLSERLFTVTQAGNGSANQYFIEALQPMFEPENTPQNGWFLDQGGYGGVGTQGFDCGGMNPSAFFGHGYRASDSGGGNTPTDLFANFVPDQSPPWGGVNILGKGNAVFFPGSVALFNLPRRSADTTSMSMSVWVGSNDFPIKAGALISSPALTFAKAQLGTLTTSCMLGGPGLSSTGLSSIVAASQWGQGYPAPAEVDIERSTTVSTLNWSHFMISAQSDGSGNINVTLVINDTVIYNNLNMGTVGNNNDMWMFNTVRDYSGDNGQDIWCIGGQMVQRPQYDLQIQPINVSHSTSPLTIQQVLALAKTKYGYPSAISPAPTFSSFLNSLVKGLAATSTGVVGKLIGGSGGPTNIPFPTGQGGLTGYIGNVAEMWVMPGQFIDWTVAANRLKFHEFDTVSDSWGPVSLGKTGAKPGFGTPMLYLSGGPRLFPTNRATGQVLTETDTAASSFIDYDTGLGGGLQASDLAFP